MKTKVPAKTGKIFLLNSMIAVYPKYRRDYYYYGCRGTNNQLFFGKEPKMWHQNSFDWNFFSELQKYLRRYFNSVQFIYIWCVISVLNCTRVSELSKTHRNCINIVQSLINDYLADFCFIFFLFWIYSRQIKFFYVFLPI